MPMRMIRMMKMQRRKGTLMHAHARSCTLMQSLTVKTGLCSNSSTIMSCASNCVTMGTGFLMLLSTNPAQMSVSSAPVILSLRFSPDLEALTSFSSR